MAYSQRATDKQELIRAVATRADGSISQMVIQDQEGNVHAQGYFPPGTVVDTWDSVRYHWSDSFTDEELRLYFAQDGSVDELRAQSRVANETHVFHHRTTEKQHDT